MFTKKTVRDIDLRGKTIILHGELDAPLNEAGTEVTSDFRVRCSVPTIQYLQEQDCKIVLISKLGRPDGKVDPKQSLKPVAASLAKVLDQDVHFVADCVGDEVKNAVKDLQPRGVVLLENLRFHPEEEENNEDFAKQIVADTGAEVFVQDCFALAHRKEAGTDAITRCLPSVAGLHLEQEVDTITKVMAAPEKPLAAIVGGAKIADKIDVLNKFIEMANFVAVGGAMANTFLVAQGHKIGKSKYDADELDLARDILAKAEAKSKSDHFTFYLPQDGVVATSVDKNASTRLVDWDADLIADVQSYPKAPDPQTQKVADDEMILDVGPFSAAFIAGGVQLASTVIWNGALGVTETPALNGPVGPFAHGTEVLIEALTGEFGSRPFVVVGGGDTVGYIEQRQLTGEFNHVSAGGGASLELMAGRKLPGVEALLDK
ncbi:MAG TPA: phosphoglycerate kinase [Patescibacteria group bacterium]|nr:phosphoglycerate kinase [Patescibacteria group bacterium]